MELWRPVPVRKYRRLYEISDLGRVRSLDRIAQRPQGVWRYKGRVLRYGFSRGYPVVTLSRDGELKTYGVHQLVARAFIPKPRPELEVNHKDGDKTNPKLDNLEWLTHAENMKHSVRTGLRKWFVGYGGKKRNPNGIV